MSSFSFRSASKLSVSFLSRNSSRRTLQTSKVTILYTNSISSKVEKTCFGNNDSFNSLTIGKRNFHAARINQQFSSLSSIIPTTTIKSSFSTQSRRVFTNITNTQLKQRIIMSGTGTLIPQTLKNNINNVTPDSNGHLLSPNNASPNRNYSTSSHDENNLDNTKDSGHSNNHAELTRWSLAWWKEWTIIFIVFGITGSTTVRCVRPIVTNLLGIEGSFLEGPWSYRLTYLSITLPLYSLILLIIGTIAGRHAFFKNVVVRMWGRLIPTRLINVAKRRE